MFNVARNYALLIDSYYAYKLLFAMLYTSTFFSWKFSEVKILLRMNVIWKSDIFVWDEIN